jgi:hypothetical protein
MTATQPGPPVVDLDSGERDPWIIFAATVLGLAGVMRILDAIWAFGFKGSLPENLEDGILGSNIKSYAWTWLVVGVILLVSSVLLLGHSQIARWVGFVAAAVVGLTAMAWMPYYPVWSLMYITGAVLVFYARARHGGREAP